MIEALLSSLKLISSVALILLSIPVASRAERKTTSLNTSLDGVGIAPSSTPVIQAQLGSSTLRAYSVIVVADSNHASSLFFDRARVKTYGGSGVAAVQYTEIAGVEDIPFVPGRDPFDEGHPMGVDERIRIVQVSNRITKRGQPALNSNQLSHLEASCKDPTETTIIIVTDEACISEALFWSTACEPNEAYVFRSYPSSNPSPDEALRYPYIPLGPRGDTFPFINSSRRQTPASSRELIFNLQVSRGTPPRRDDIIDITTTYISQNPNIKAHLNGNNLSRDQWQSLLLGSKFTISPGGHNPETFRMFEALEAGSIPIVSKKDYLDPAFSYGNNPHPCGEGSAAWNTVAASPFAQAVSVDSWEDLPQLLDELLDMPDDTIDQLQVECGRWYEALMRGTFASLLNASSFPKFWPQEGPIMPLDLLESAPP